MLRLLLLLHSFFTDYRIIPDSLTTESFLRSLTVPLQEVSGP